MPTLNEENCEVVQNRLDAYLDDELADRIAGANIARHLESCPDCRESAESILIGKKLLRRAARNDIARDALREKIQKKIRGERRFFGFLFTPGFLTAAAVVLLVCLGLFGIFFRQQQSLANLAGKPHLNQTFSGQITELLNVGLNNHVHCALEEGYARQRSTVEEVSGELGAEYAGLLPLVKEKTGDEFEVVSAHHCVVDERNFVHLIMRKDEKILSLVVTKKTGETFSGRGDALSRSSGVALYQEAIENYAVAGFETETDLVFFVSDLTGAENLRIASRTAPAVRNFLDKPNVKL